MATALKTISTMQASCSGRRAATPATPLQLCRVHHQQPRRPAARGSLQVVRSHKVEIEHEGKTYSLDVPDGMNILEVALEKGLDLPHDCKLGVCMTCPAKLVAGQVDQSGSMLSDDVAEKGYALLCMAVPQSDVKIMTVSEDELLEEQLCA